MADLAALAEALYPEAAPPAPADWRGGFPPAVPALLRQLQARKATTVRPGPIGSAPGRPPAQDQSLADMIYPGGPQQSFDSE